MADAILAKGSGRPVDIKPTEGSTNLVTSGGVYEEMTKIADSLPPEIHIGSTVPTGEQVVWFDTSDDGSLNTDDYVLLQNSTIYVDGVNGNDTTGTGASDRAYKTLGAAFRQVPKNLNGYNVTINVTSATYPEDLVITGFFGGKVILKGNNYTVKINRLTLENNTYIGVEGIDLDINTGITLFNSDLHTDSDIIVGSFGIEVTNASNLYTSNNSVVTVNNANNAVLANELSNVFIGTLAGSGNVNAVVSDSGSNVNVINMTMTATVLYSTYGRQLKNY